MSSKLSDEELASLDQWASADLTTDIAQEIWALTEEVRQTRALLARPWPERSAWSAPAPNVAVTGWVAWDGQDMKADEAIALGAALVRAGLQAKGAR